MADTKNSQALPPTTAPDPAFKRLEKLIGTWDMHGHTLDTKEDNVGGWNTFEWTLGGCFLKSFGQMSFMDAKFESLEILGYDPKAKTFPSKAYSSMSSDVLDYGWDVQGNTVTHWDANSIYTGTLSADGQTLTGGWRPKAGHPEAEGNAYDVVMTKRK
jgi:Protein of unknown function (DUF1579)